jgi:hypothetical protein
MSSEEASSSEQEVVAQETLNNTAPEVQALVNREESRAAEKIAELLEQK